MGNALENAIEACNDLHNPNERFISNDARVLNNYLLIKVKNSYNGCLNYHDGNYLSTKNGNARGMGIMNFKKVVESYGGYTKIEHDEKVFTLMAVFPLSAGDKDVQKNIS